MLASSTDAVGHFALMASTLLDGGPMSRRTRSVCAVGQGLAMSHPEFSKPAARQSADAVPDRRSSLAMQTGHVARWPYFFVLLLAVLATACGYVCARRGLRFDLNPIRSRRTTSLARVSINQALPLLDDNCLTDGSADRVERISPFLIQVAVVESLPCRASVIDVQSPLTCASNSGAPWCARE
jgi:hypothetical protein